VQKTQRLKIFHHLASFGSLFIWSVKRYLQYPNRKLCEWPTVRTCCNKE